MKDPPALDAAPDGQVGPGAGLLAVSRAPFSRFSKAETLTLAPVVAAAATYLVILLSRLGAIFHDLYWNSDNASYAVISEDIGRTGLGGLTIMGNQPAYTTLWFFRLTNFLPFHRWLWAVAPFALSVLAVCIVAWAAGRVAGWWAAIAVVSFSIAASSSLLGANLPTGRTPTWFADAVLLAILVALGGGSGTLSWPRLGFLCAAIGIFGGISLASDPLFLASGLGPFLGAALIAALFWRNRRSWQVFLMGLGALVLALPVAVVLSLWMHRTGFRSTFPSAGFTIATPAQMLQNLKTATADLALLWNGYFPGQPAGWQHFVSLILAGLLVASVVILPILTGRRLLRHSSTNRDPSEQALTLFLIFWMLAGAGVVVAFVVTTVAVGSGHQAARYLVPAFYALAAAMPVWASRVAWRRLVFSGGACMFCSLSILGISDFKAYGAVPLAREGPVVISYLNSKGLTRGYSGYWDSHGITYQSHMRIHAYPVFECPQASAFALCTFPLATRTKWYRAEKVSTFLLVDPTVPFRLPFPPPADLGAPTAVRRFKDIVVYIYDYDLASRLSRYPPSAP